MVRWSYFGSDAAFQYNAIASAILYIEDVILCNDIKCTTDHSNDIDNFYDLLVVAFTEGTRDFRVRNTKKFVPVPGWNQYCKQLYAEAREDFLEWLRSGKIRYGDEYEKMKVKRKELVNALKYCKKNETKIRNDKMASAFWEKTVKEFWKQVRHRRKGANAPIDEIYSLISAQSIAAKFARWFSTVTGNVPCGRGVDFRARDQFAQAAVHHVFSIVDVQVAVSKLNTGLGFHVIHSNHLKFASTDISRILA